MQKLYKRDNTGSTRVWYAEIDGGRYRTCSGTVDGNETKSKWTQCISRNDGRSNATNPEEQCRKEVDSLYTKKLKRGYTKTLEEIDQEKEKLISPMLAHKWGDHCLKIEWPVSSQPKLDGIRCIIRSDGAFSRKGEPINTVPHITDLMVPIAKRLGVVFDGELYNHDFRDNFNKIQSLVTKKSVTPEQARDVRRYVQYHVYDIIDETKRFRDRFETLFDIIDEDISSINESVVLVHTIHCGNSDLLDKTYAEYLEQGFEGQMIRANSKYERKRSKSLLKRKEFEDAEFEIIGMVEGKGNRAEMVGAIVFETSTGKQFQAALMGTDAYRRAVWQDRESYLGIDATVKYQNLTPDGVPRFPVVKIINPEGK